MLSVEEKLSHLKSLKNQKKTPGKLPAQMTNGGPPPKPCFAHTMKAGRTSCIQGNPD